MDRKSTLRLFEKMKAGEKRGRGGRREVEVKKGVDTIRELRGVVSF